MELFAPGELDRNLAEQQQNSGGLLELAREEYHALLDTFIAPVRRAYSLDDLGPRRFDFAYEAEFAAEATGAAAGQAGQAKRVTVRTQVVRADFELTNLRGAILHCSLWRQLLASAPATPNDGNGGGGSSFNQLPLQSTRPCVVLVHDYGCARPDMLPCLAPCLAAGCDVCAFDCSGAGHSTGRCVERLHARAAAVTTFAG